MKKIWHLSLAVLLVVLTGCSAKVDEVNQKIKDIENEPSQRVPNPPQSIQLENLGYNAHSLRNPFLPLSVSHQLQVLTGKQVLPDVTRPKEPLELYSVESLQFKGTLQKSGNSEMTALVSTPDGAIVRVQVGNYIGQSFGRITKITADQIEMVEVVPDGRGGFVERPRILNLNQKSIG